VNEIKKTVEGSKLIIVKGKKLDEKGRYEYPYLRPVFVLNNEAVLGENESIVGEISFNKECSMAEIISQTFDYAVKIGKGLIDLRTDDEKKEHDKKYKHNDPSLYYLEVCGLDDW
jgi:hypothetical protein